METTEPITGFRARQARAALDRMAAEQEKWTAVSAVLDLSRRGRMLEMFEVGNDDYLVQVALSGTEYWCAVVNGERPRQYFPERDEALLHLVAVRHHGPNTQAHEWAARMLGCHTPV